MSSERVARTQQALRSAPAHALPETLDETATVLFGASQVELLVADYRSGVLASVRGDGEPMPVDTSPAGRAFASQQMVTGNPVTGRGRRVWLPLTARGHRFGVLGLTLPEHPDVSVAAELGQVATALAHELVAAETCTDVYRRARRTTRLTMAAEMQWDMLPARGLATADFTAAGQLEPAYAVCGDTFDWAADTAGLTAAVINGMGEGMPAAMLTGFAIAALRNARRSGDDIGEQAALAGDLLYLHYGGRRYLDTLLLRYQPATRTLWVIDAGSPMLLRQRGTSVETIELDCQPPLGLADDIRYTRQKVPVQPGDRLIAVSDGVHAAVNSTAEAYSLSALASVLRRTRLQPCGEAVRTVIRDVLAYHGTALDDDAVVLALDIL